MADVTDAMVAIFLGGVDDGLEVFQLLRDGAVFEFAARFPVAREGKTQCVKSCFFKSFGQTDRPWTILVTGHSMTDDRE